MKNRWKIHNAAYCGFGLLVKRNATLMNFTHHLLAVLEVISFCGSRVHGSKKLASLIDCVVESSIVG